jgi:hypothetical protein
VVAFGMKMTLPGYFHLIRDRGAADYQPPAGGEQSPLCKKLATSCPL